MLFDCYSVVCCGALCCVCCGVFVFKLIWCVLLCWVVVCDDVLVCDAYCVCVVVDVRWFVRVGVCVCCSVCRLCELFMLFGVSFVVYRSVSRRLVLVCSGLVCLCCCNMWCCVGG